MKIDFISMFHVVRKLFFDNMKKIVLFRDSLARWTTVSVAAGNELMAFEKTKMHNGFFPLLLFLENYESTRYFGPCVHDM